MRLFKLYVLCFSLDFLSNPGSTDDESKVFVILEKIDSLVTPEMDVSREKDEAYIRDFRKRRGEVRLSRANLIAELYEVAPEHPRLRQLLPVRWRALSGRMAGPDSNNEGARDLGDELDRVAANARDPRLKRDAAYFKAWILSDPLNRVGSLRDKQDKAKAVDSYVVLAPDDPRGADLLLLLSQCFEGDRDRQKEIYTRIVRDYPGGQSAGEAQQSLTRMSLVGQEFRLSFKDAISGVEVSTDKLNGRLVVVDFWATWCAPCVAEVPRMKEIHAKYRDRGVTFMGVSLNVPEEEGGLAKLKGFVAKHSIPWPQYYQGGGWDGEFSRRCGVNSVPTIFLIDTDGKIASVDAGEHLESEIMRLLDRKPGASK